MKRLLFSIGAGLAALLAGAQTTVELSPNSWDDGGVKYYNSQGMKSVRTGEWKTGDVIQVSLAGIAKTAVADLSYSLVDNSNGNWISLSENKYIGTFEANGEISVSEEVALIADVVTPGSVIAVFGTGASTEAVSESITLEFSSFSITKPGEVLSDKVELPLTGLNAWEGNSYDDATKTITFKQWGGCGWWLNEPTSRTMQASPSNLSQQAHRGS